MNRLPEMVKRKAELGQTGGESWRDARRNISLSAACRHVAFEAYIVQLARWAERPAADCKLKRRHPDDGVALWRFASLAEQAGGAVHDEAAIQQAWGRVRKFFGRHLSADPRVQEIVGGVEGPTRRAQVFDLGKSSLFFFFVHLCCATFL